MKTVVSLAGLAALAGMLAWRADSQPDDVGAAAGVEVQTRGPVHEAFAQPALRRQGQAPTIDKKPPEPIPELPPEQRPEGDNVQWLPGYWAWDEDRSDFLWVSGVWRIPPPDHHWVPGYWVQEDDGYQWVSGYWAAFETTSTELLPSPPDPVPEAIPVAPDQESTYVPGIWVYRERRYWWRPGYWIAYRPGWTWCTAGYYWTPGGYVFVDGHWDHDLHHRGLCFAPVYIDRRFYGRPGWYYQPRYAVAADFFLGSLFVNLGWNHYYFGDYYDARYGRSGYYPWVDFRIGNRFYDPLFTYYRWHHRGDPRWEQDLRATYVARRDNASSRPPRTFAEQQKLEGTAKGKQVQMVASLDRLQQSTNIKLQAVSKIQVQQVQKSANELRVLSQSRKKMEGEARANLGTKAPSEPIRIDLPKPSQFKTTAKGDKAPPPRPALPKVSTIAPEKTPGVQPKEPGVTPKEPKVTPKEPKVVPKEPKVIPKEPKVIPKEPKVKPEEPKVIPKEPKVIPKEPAAKPKPPPPEPKEPPPPKEKGGQPGKKKKDKDDAIDGSAWLRQSSPEVEGRQLRLEARTEPWRPTGRGAGRAQDGRAVA